MKFLVDAQLPPLLAVILSDHGFDTVHTNTLELGNNTPDQTVIRVCSEQDRILITKDLDFYHSKMLHDKPKKLLLVKVGNCKTRTLLDLFRRNISKLESIFKEASLVEMYQEEFIVLY